MIERTRQAIALPLTNSDRKRLYLIRLIRSPHWDEHDYAHRVSIGRLVLMRLHAHWRRKAREKALAALPERRVLSLTHARGG